MNKTKTSTVCAALAAVTVCGLFAQPTLAYSKKVVTTTTVGPTYVSECGISGVNSFTFTDFSTKPAVVITRPSTSATIMTTTLRTEPVALVTTPNAVITALTVFRPDDLITRRDDLLARIAIEQSNGVLDSNAAANLLARVSSIDARRIQLPAVRDTEYFKEVKSMYRDYDKVSSDMCGNSHQGNKQLAGTYSCVTF